MSDLVGTTIGPYQITQRLGRGGMADVYKAFHRELSIHRAIKFIRPEFVTSDDFRARFQQEAQSVARLRHPNIVQIHDFGVSDGHFYMVMEFLEGRTLKELLRTTGRTTPSTAVNIVKGVAEALEYAHSRDLIHRDIKPDNIMIDLEGRPVLMDFGIAKLVTASTQLTQTGAGIGTPAYMAPEQARGEPVSPATDIYALSIVLFELLTGQVPYNADTPMAIMLKALSDPLPMPRSFNPDISEALQGVILKGTAKAPEARYRSAVEFIAALDSAINEKTTDRTAPPAPALVDNASSIKSANAGSTTAISWTIATAIGVAAVIGIWTWTHQTTEVPPVEVPAAAAPANNRSGPSEESALQIVAPAPSSDTSRVPSPEAPVSSASNEPVLWSHDGTITPGLAIDLPVQLVAGDVLYLRVLQNPSGAEIVLSTPGDLAEVFRANADSGPATVKHEGVHHLLVTGTQPGELKATLYHLREPQLHAGSVYLQDVFAHTTDLPGQVLHRYLDLNQNTVLRFNLIRSAVPTEFILVAPDEHTQVFSTRESTGPIRIPVSGVHSFYADPAGSALADFEASFEAVPSVPTPKS